MEQPRLKYNNQEIGLRSLGEGLFEPKNLSVFNDAVSDQLKFDSTPKKFWLENSPPKHEPKKYHKIESFCFVATANLKDEAEVLLRTLRLFHDEPVYVICDKETRIHLKRMKLCDNVKFKTSAEKEHLDTIQEKVFEGHSCVANDIHHAPSIVKKMEAMDFALKLHDNTFFLDTDIIVLDNLQEYFTAEVVLSPHFYPKDKQHKGFEFGFYNAGYLFCANKGFPRFWRHLYLTDSTFFEQECMNRISDYYNIQTFSKEHNVGFWRGDALPIKAKSVHTHISELGSAGRGLQLIGLNKITKDYALSQTKNKPIINSYLRKHYNPDCNKKLAFIHFGKAAGVYIQHYIREQVFPRMKHFNSWWDFNYKNKRALTRDWTEEELLEIADANVEEALTHNHHINWTKESVKKFNDNGWLTFMFIRNPKDIMCSLYFWAQSQWDRWDAEDKSAQVLREPLTEELKYISGQDNPYNVSLDDFIRGMLSGKGAQYLWVLPDYIDDVQHVAEFNNNNFSSFLLDNFQHLYVPMKKRNTSKSEGYKTYLERGEISKETHSMVESHPEYKRYLKYLK
tara:strand:- start:28201 stop:29898 length:1698 start_codon:yes stop_codon:yes gene_type:complete